MPRLRKIMSSQYANSASLPYRFYGVLAQCTVIKPVDLFVVQAFQVGFA
jgi:hypothetical protein